MNEQKTSLNPFLKRGLICGLILGVILSFVVAFVRIYPNYWIYLIFLLVIGIVSYKFVGDPFSSAVFGLTTFIVKELVSSILFGSIPFYGLNYLLDPYFGSQVIIVYAIGFVGFPVVGYIIGKVCQTRGITRVLTSANISLNDLESKVLSYIKSNNNQIRTTDCALELGVDSDSVKKALKSLEKKGKLRI